MGADYINWTKSGKRYHLYNTCGYKKGKRKNEIFQGTTGHGKVMKKILELCSSFGGQVEKRKTTSNLLDLGVDEEEHGILQINHLILLSQVIL